MLGPGRDSGKAADNRRRTAAVGAIVNDITGNSRGTGNNGSVERFSTPEQDRITGFQAGGNGIQPFSFLSY
jgi:ribosomal protein L3